jgi:cyclophilin family peptidyl-prolyl cis-trans isomerase
MWRSPLLLSNPLVRFSVPLLSRASFHSTPSIARGSKHLDWFVREARAKELAPSWKTPAVFPLEPLHGKLRARAYFDFSFNAPQQRAAGGSEERSAATSAEVGGGGSSAVSGDVKGAVAASSNSTPLVVKRVVFELADDIVPLTVTNFLALAAAPRDTKRGYVGADVFRVQKGHAIFIGDASAGVEGRSGHSAFRARYFPDENFIARHSEPFVLAMASSGVHSNGSVFYITLAKAPHLGEWLCVLKGKIVIR